MTVYDMAKAYYPRLWPENRILSLLEAGRLTQQEADDILDRNGPKEV